MTIEKGAEIFKISKKYLYAAIKPIKISLDKEIVYCRDYTICEHCLNGTSETCRKFCPKPIVRDYSLCSKNCKFYDEREKNEYCKWQCEKCAKIDTIEKKYLLNETRKYGISSSLNLLSRLQISQYLYLCARSGGSSYVKNITKIEISKALNCSIKSVINNMDALVIKGYILYSIYNNAYNVILNNYSDMFKTKEQGGTGYVEFTKQDLIDMCSIQGINELRFNIRIKLEHNNQVEFKKSTSPYIDRTYIKACFPFVVKKELNKLLEKYKITVGGLNNKLYYLPNVITLDNRVNQMKIYIVTSLKDFIAKNNIVLPVKDINDTITDVTIAAINFGLSVAYKALNLYKERYINNNIINIGGYIRTLCQEVV